MANPSMDRDVVAWLRKQLQEAHPDLLREMLATMVQELMGAEAQQLCGAEYGERSSERTNSRNGYREREWDTRVGSIELAVPKLRRGSYFPDWLLEPRRRAERRCAAPRKARATSIRSSPRRTRRTNVAEVGCWSCDASSWSSQVRHRRRPNEGRKDDRGIHPLKGGETPPFGRPRPFPHRTACNCRPA